MCPAPGTVITSGAPGIGRATADLQAARGADVAVLGPDVPAVDKPLHGYTADVSHDTVLRAAADTTADGLGGNDIPVNNAGSGAVGTVEDNTDDGRRHERDRRRRVQLQAARRPRAGHHP
ncbi:SDR family NAD(P)-dependent oxidoreductase [Streptomyces sp. NPDC051020]|uniref:SDR family NAD(P)-dependent oxidoreductase n=1 Tax=Streptomyces sp. NPDC051020 TaxID=3155409 RepID=UPI00341BEEBE